MHLKKSFLGWFLYFGSTIWSSVYWDNHCLVNQTKYTLWLHLSLFKDLQRPPFVHRIKLKSLSWLLRPFRSCPYAVFPIISLCQVPLVIAIIHQCQSHNHPSNAVDFYQSCLLECPSSKWSLLSLNTQYFPFFEGSGGTSLRAFDIGYLVLTSMCDRNPFPFLECMFFEPGP